ncbi:flagellar protein FliT [Brevibacillus brevis]|uniref:flagellar protein FliT n=1 Tax=Brevibacillus brevis TaxID=1393 RepID=UPI0019016534|nr:flagellar protein FliT [Brevibacillus brevis]MBH0328303.1 flagellar protein FliT [Brevibacillus brevis]
MEMTINALLGELLQATQRLEQTVTLKDSDAEEWLAILDEREVLIGTLKERVEEVELTPAQRVQMVEIHEINQRVIPLIDGRKQGVQQQLNNLQRSKLAMNTYNEAGPNGYGAFFDRKK